MAVNRLNLLTFRECLVEYFHYVDRGGQSPFTAEEIAVVLFKMEHGHDLNVDARIVFAALTWVACL